MYTLYSMQRSGNCYKVRVGGRLLTNTALGTIPLVGQGTVAVTADTCPGDLFGDHDVDIDDLLEVISHWGNAQQPPGSMPADAGPPGGPGAGAARKRQSLRDV